MMMKKLMTAAMLAALCALPAFAGIMEKDVIVIGTESTYKPYEFRGTDGSLQGYDIDLAEAVCAKLGKKVQWSDQAYDGLIPALLMNKIDMIASGMAATPERQKKISFTQPVSKQSICAFVTKPGVTVTGLQDLKGKKVPLQTGSYYEKFARSVEGAEVYLYGKNDDCIREVMYGRMDIALIDTIVATEMLQSKEFKGKVVIAYQEGMNKYLRAFGINKHEPEFLAAVDKTISDMKANGEFDAIYDKWFKK